MRGYDRKYEVSFSLLDRSLKKTVTGKQLIASLEESKITANGQIFPTMMLLNENKQPQELKPRQEKYTLIDFWFSHCGPCIAQFPELKEVYNTYRDKGFNIIGISVDYENDEIDWRKAIEKHELVWEQLWDKNGKKSGKYYINSYPTNFLLDASGKILQKNIKPDQLKKFLAKEL